MNSTRATLVRPRARMNADDATAKHRPRRRARAGAARGTARRRGRATARRRPRTGRPRRTPRARRAAATRPRRSHASARPRSTTPRRRRRRGGLPSDGRCGYAWPGPQSASGAPAPGASTGRLGGRAVVVDEHGGGGRAHALADDRAQHAQAVAERRCRLLSPWMPLALEARHLGRSAGRRAATRMLISVSTSKPVAVERDERQAAAPRRRCSRSRGRCSGCRRGRSTMPRQHACCRAGAGGVMSSLPPPGSEARALGEVGAGDERGDEARDLGRVGRAVGVEHDDDVAGRGGEAGARARRPCRGRSA